MSFNPYGLIIELNMSNDVDYLNNIISYQPNTPFLYDCHNFYPQVGTGLPFDYFIKCSQRFKKLGIHSAAFVSSKVGEKGPWSVSDGLPTLEMDRKLPIDVQAKQLWATGLIDDVIIDNANASEAELAALAQVDRYLLTLEVDFVADINPIEETIVKKPLHFWRGDINSLEIRSTMPRVTYREEGNPTHDNELEFPPGDVLVGNDGFGPYKNELQIVRQAHREPRKNKVGSIKQEQLFLLDFLKPWSKFKLK